MRRYRTHAVYAALFLALGAFFVWVILQMVGGIPGDKGSWRVQKMALVMALVVVALLAGVVWSWRQGRSR